MNAPVSTLRLYTGANILSVILALVLNYLAVSLPLNDRTTGELSDMYPNFFVPAGFTFAIWGIIYLLMIAFMLYQAWQVSRQDKTVSEAVMSIGPWFLFSGIANASWIIAWHYEAVVVSVLIMLMLLYSLIKVYLAASGLQGPGFWDKALIRVPFSVYLGWISVATIANFTTLFVSAGWSGGAGGPYWAIAMILVASFLGIVMVFTRQDVFYTAVIIWALYGIYSKQSGLTLDGSAAVAITAKFAMTMLTIFTALNLVGKKTYFSAGPGKV